MVCSYLQENNLVLNKNDLTVNEKSWLESQSCVQPCVLCTFDQVQKYKPELMHPCTLVFIYFKTNDSLFSVFHFKITRAGHSSYEKGLRVTAESTDRGIRRPFLASTHPKCFYHTHVVAFPVYV